MVEHSLLCGLTSTATPSERMLMVAGPRKDEFLATLAYELRDPLASIGVAAALLGHNGADVDRVHPSSAVITRQVQHRTGLDNELLDVARVTGGLITLDTTILYTKRIVAEVLEQM